MPLICLKLTELTTFWPDFALNYTSNDSNSYTLPHLFTPHQLDNTVAHSPSKIQPFFATSLSHIYKAKMAFRGISSRSDSRSESFWTFLWVHQIQIFKKCAGMQFEFTQNQVFWSESHTFESHFHTTDMWERSCINSRIFDTRWGTVLCGWLGLESCVDRLSETWFWA